MLFKDADGTEQLVIEMLKRGTEKLRNEVSAFVGLTNEELSIAASILSDELYQNEKGKKISIWLLPRVTKVTNEAKKYAEKAKKKVKDPEIIVMCESVYRDVIEASKETSKANLLVTAANFGGVKQRFHSCVSKAKAASNGGNARAEQYGMIERIVIGIWENECSMSDSADKAAEEIIGRVKLSHRKIADIIRKHKKDNKLLDAMKKAHKAA